jgi:hypothetical protein
MPKFEKATTGDYIACLIIPFWGAVIGLAALLRGQKKRGLAMMAVGSIWLAVLLVVRYA